MRRENLRSWFEVFMPERIAARRRREWDRIKSVDWSILDDRKAVNDE